VTLYFNLESLVLPDSQVHPFYTPSSRPIFGDVRRCSTMFGEVRRGSARFGDVIRCYPMFSDVRRCSTMFNDVRRCSTMFGDIIRCSAILSELQFTIVTQLHTIPALQVTLDKPRHMTSSLDTTISQVYATLSTPMLPVATLAHGTRSPAKNRTAHSSHSRVHPSLGSPSAWTPLSSSRHPKAMTPSWSLWIDSPNKPTLSIYS